MHTEHGFCETDDQFPEDVNVFSEVFLTDVFSVLSES